MRRLLVILIAVSYGMLFCQRFNGEPNTSSMDQTAKSRISIAILSKQTVAKVGDPIVLDIVVKNISEFKFCETNIVENNHAEWNGYDVVVKNTVGVEVPHIVKPLLPLRQRPELSASRGKLCITPGDTFKESLIANQLVEMSEPGTYLVQVVHRDQGTDTQVTSNALQIRVTQ